MSEKERKKLTLKLKPLFDGIYELTDDDGIEIASIFQTLPDRKLADYYRIILNPHSLNKIKVNLNKNRYSNPQAFIHELVQITWNARTYNQKGSYIYNHAVILNNYILEQVIPKLRADKTIPNHNNLHYPDLGPLPENEALDMSTPTAMVSHIDLGHPTQVSTPQQQQSHDEIDEEDENEEEEEFYVPRKRNRAAPPNSKDDAWVKRGRPPVVDRPHEQRIKNIVKALKKTRNPHDPNAYLYLPFDRLPDAKMYPDYYERILNPMCLDVVRIKIKQRKYQDVSSFVADINLIIANCKLYNLPTSELFQDCLIFEDVVNRLILEETSKPDSEYYANEAGQVRIPLDQLELHGKIYKVGDWVLLANPNDANKPTVAQVFRIWSTDDGKRWINVCWYYRPEQTVHRVDRLFYANEVCKTGQYRDHLAEEITGKCYVMFLTRYQKGDLAIPLEGPFFICEFRYNDDNYVFNRIRTWKACLPDEVRSYEDPIIPLQGPRRIQKFESPLKQLLPADATDDMDPPEPQIGAPNAPPIVGGVYLRPPDLEDDLGQYSTSVPKNNNKQISNSPAPLPLPNAPMPGMPPTSTFFPNNNNIARTGSQANFQSPLSQNQLPVGNYRNYQAPGQPFNKVHHATTVYSQPTTTSTFTIAAELNGDLSPAAGGIQKSDQYSALNATKPIIWYRTPPVLVTSRIQNNAYLVGEKSREKHILAKSAHEESSELESIETQFVDGPGAGFGGFSSMGHSTEYLAWKIRNKQSI